MYQLKPYLIRAIRDWISDNNQTTYILVRTAFPDIQVPEKHIRNGKIVLNISPFAVNNIIIDSVNIIFDAQFSGIDSHIVVPIAAVLSIYSKEHGKGMVFDHSYTDPSDPNPPTDNKPKPKLKPKLTIVK
jgi:stringent starvation protein B